MSGSGNQLYLNHLLLRHSITILQPVSWLSVKSMVTNSSKLLLDFNAICELSDTLWVLPCASRALHCLLLLCLAVSSVQLSCLNLQNQFFQCFVHILTLLTHPALGRELKDGRTAKPVGQCWTASVAFSRGMAGREWSGWGWNFLRVEGWRSQITQQFSQIDPWCSSAADCSGPSGRVPVWQTGCQFYQWQD